MSQVITSLNQLLSLNISWAFIIATLGGILPALLWLFFWLQEDEHPEPRKLIFTSFLLGMVCVVLVLPFEALISAIFLQGKSVSNLAQTGLLLTVFSVVLWASTEEIFKYYASHIGTKYATAIDEPIDWVIYMISTALGFAAAENTLFILNPLFNNEISTGIITGNLRFIGPTMLHLVCSATVGIAMAFAFYRSPRAKKAYKYFGLFTAIVLHTCFNLFIMFNEKYTLLVFCVVWGFIIALILVLERIKRIAPTPLNN